jgi:hypothetical protein
MASFRLEQPGASFEGVMFEKTLATQTIPPHDTVVVAYGVVDRNFDGSMVRFTLNRLVPLEDVRQERVKSMTVRIDPGLEHEGGGVTKIADGVAQLRQLVGASPGPTPFRLHLLYKEAEVLIEPPEGMGIEITDDFLFSLKRLPFRKISTHCTWASVSDEGNS